MAEPTPGSKVRDRGLPRAILFDLDGTLIAAGQRPQVLLSIAWEFAADLLPIPPAEVADRLKAALEAFWSDPDRHRTARFGIPQARRGVIAESFAAHGSDRLTPELAVRFETRFTAARDELIGLFPGARETLEKR